METSSPAEQGVAASGIAAFLDAVEADPTIEPHGLIVQRHGRRVVEGHWAPHAAGTSRLVYSLSKTFTGTALGLMVGEGRLALDDLVSDHLPQLFDDRVDPATRRMKIRHIASMTSGHDHETFLEAAALDPDDPVRGFLHLPPEAEPGTLFTYNQPPVLALATIVQRLAGETLTAYLRPRVLDPIGVGPFSWAQSRTGLDMGFSGVHTDLDAIARLGQLYLDDGVRDGRRLLPEGWVAQASAKQIDNSHRDEPDWQQGYGFQLWRSQHGYRGDGAFGQYCLVLPEQDAVVALFSCVEAMQTVMDLVWEHLLPALGDAPLPPGPGDEALRDRLSRLALPTAADRVGGGAPVPPPAGRYAPVPHRSRSHRTITAMEVDGGRLLLHEDGATVEVPLTAAWTTVDRTLAASAATRTDGRLSVDLALLATPHRLELDLDPASRTFTTRWPIVPLFGAGLSPRLSSMRPPA